MTELRDGKVLERRPKADSFSVEDLVQQVLDGRIRVPKFQRNLRWEPGDVERLLDSVYRGYPIGTLLFWVRHGGAQRIDYGTVTVDAREMSEAWWVVDGQQRLNALVRSLAGAGFPVEEFALYFDLQTQEFVRPRFRGTVPGHWLPLTEVVDSERLMAWILDHPNVERSLAISVGKRIREYSIPAYLITTEAEDAVREIFARLNETGKRMLPGEVFSALHGARQGNSPADARDVGVRLLELGFGALDPELLHSMMLATLGVDVSKNRVPRLDDAAAKQALIDLENAGRSVIQFLRQSAKIPHVELLPYELPLVTLTRFFHFFPEAEPRNRELLSRWVWRGAFSSQHQGNTTSKRATLEAIVKGEEHESVQRLLKMVPAGDWRLPEFDGFRFQDARGKLLTLALWSLGPRHLQTGAAIHIANDASALFPPARITTAKLSGLLTNRMIHPPVACQTFRDLILATEDGEILASHGLDAEMVDALRDRSYDLFLALRELHLVNVVRDFATARTRPGAVDRAPLAALVLDDRQLEERE